MPNQKINLNKINKVYFVGIGGIGISALAKMMLAENKIVIGSDISFSDISKQIVKLGAIVYKNHKQKNLSNDVDLLIYSSAVPDNNAERQKARKLNIPCFSYPEFLGELSKEKTTIAVSGTNGKSTVTSMLGLVLEAGKLDPTVIVGGKIFLWNSNFRKGNSNYFLVEACEYKANMLNLYPDIILLTNIEEDHLDFYKDINHIVRVFQKYIDNLPKNGVLILNLDDYYLSKLKIKNKTITYGIKNKSDIMAKNIKTKSGYQEFDLCFNKKSINIRIKIPGRFNIYNCLATFATALYFNIDKDIIIKTLERFNGTWRRFERVGERNKAIIISDYAHHPTSIESTIVSTKEFYSNKRVFVIFQPHHHNRTKKLFNGFKKSLSNADFLIIPEIYNVAGREKQNIRNKISSKDLVNAIKKDNPKKNVFYAKDLKNAKQLVLKNIDKDVVVLAMGAGDIDDLARDLVD